MPEKRVRMGCGCGQGIGEGRDRSGDKCWEKQGDKRMSCGHVISDESPDLFMRGCFGVAVLALLSPLNVLFIVTLNPCGVLTCMWRTCMWHVILMTCTCREGWEARALLGFFESKRRAKENIGRQTRGRRPLPPVRRRR